ncbi:MAG: N-acetylglucosamine kinase [Flavobacteriales bacterium TMED235]|nr:MAG: N-acetylglucosamine kinase [Flavobacteriales bacterium TMED235]|tara:strand:- start:2345 stop:3202 length:858 start_codon:yes stop_codon:yes gene_type:complete
MILIVDSGSTKTDWISIDKKGETVFSTQTLGLNPQVLSSAILKERIINNFDLYQNRKNVTHLYFYGAGLGINSTQRRIRKVFDEIFTNSEFVIKEDTFAAVYAATKIGEKSIVCILGTGSNCTYFDGKEIEQRVTSLGYILMDEASGNFYGKQLLRSYYFKTMSGELSKEFEKEYDLSADTVKENIYRRENPNTYLATFSKFLIKHKKNEVFQDIIQKGLDRFINHQILQFENAKDVPIHFIGSISFFLKEEIEKALKLNGLTMGRLVQRPIDELVKYHKSLIDN